jgi:hypothetical protein
MAIKAGSPRACNPHFRKTQRFLHRPITLQVAGFFVSGRDLPCIFRSFVAVPGRLEIADCPNRS